MISDGGHFDNLGVYELVKRRCRLIIVSDAECDPRADLRRPGHVDPDVRRGLRRDHQHRRRGDSARARRRRGARRPAPSGEIRYGDGSTGHRSIYLKAAMTGREDTAVLQYQPIGRPSRTRPPATSSTARISSRATAAWATTWPARPSPIACCQPPWPRCCAERRACTRGLSVRDPLRAASIQLVLRRLDDTRPKRCDIVRRLRSPRRSRPADGGGRIRGAEFLTSRSSDMAKTRRREDAKRRSPRSPRRRASPPTSWSSGVTTSGIRT